MKVLSFSLRQARREWRAGELRELAVALLIAAAALAAVGAFTDRAGQALKANANELLAADLVLRSRTAPNETWLAEAERRGLSHATTVEFPSVVFFGERSLLISVKAVTAGYPLRGSLSLADRPFGEEYPAAGVPPPGRLWADARVFNQLDAGVGDALELGDLVLNGARVIAMEPDRGSTVFNLAPRVMIHYSDLPASGLIGEGSRVRYQWLLAGEASNVDAFRDWLAERLQPGQFFRSLEDSQQQIARTLERSNRFLSLAALTAVILGGIAVIISVRHFVRRHLDTVAILRCLGARQRPLLAAFALQLLWVALPALIVGCVLGYSAQAALVWSMGDLLPDGLPLPGWQPALTAVATGLLALLGYGLPPLLALGRVPPVRVLNRQIGQPRPGHVLSYVLPVGFSVVLIAWLAGDLNLTLAISGGILATLLLLTAVAALLIRALKRFSRSRSISWRFGLANVSKRGGGTLLQMAGLGLSLMVMLLLAVVQADLLKGWRDSLPEDAPNFFLINIQPDQVDAVDAYVGQTGMQSQGLFPMATARLTGLNGRTPDAGDYTDPRAEFRIRGTINVSWAAELPRGNTLVQGEWWDPSATEPQVSLAESWAEVFGLEVGDSISFSVASDEVTARVASIREVDWDSFEVNFFILLSPGAVGEVPRTYIGSLNVPPAEVNALTELSRRHSNISIIDIGSLLQRVRTIIERVSLTVQIVFLFTVLAGVTVLAAALTASLSQRTYEGAVLRTLGGSRTQLRHAVLAEFTVIGGMAGLLAGAASLVIGWVLATQVFAIPYQGSLWLPAAGAVVGAAGIGLLGLLGNRSVLRTPPMAVLRK